MRDRLAGFEDQQVMAVTEAFGGQVMGSKATALRRRSGPSVSLVNACSQRRPLVRCERCGTIQVLLSAL